MASAFPSFLSSGETDWRICEEEGGESAELDELIYNYELIRNGERRLSGGVEGYLKIGQECLDGQEGDGRYTILKITAGKTEQAAIDNYVLYDHRQEKFCYIGGPDYEALLDENRARRADASLHIRKPELVWK